MKSFQVFRTTVDDILKVSIVDGLTISGDVTIDTTLLSKDATLTNGTQKTQITNGTDVAAVLNVNPSTSAYGLVVRNIPSGVQNVQGIGNAGTPTGGLLTVQGDPSGKPVPITGSFFTSIAAVGLNGDPAPTSSIEIGVTDGSSTLESLRGLTTTPVGTELGLITRNIPGGTQTVSGVVSIINDTALNTISGVVSVLNFPVTQAVSGTIAVSNPVTSLSVSNFPTTQNVNGTVNAIIASGLYTVTGHVTIDQMPALTIDTSALALNSTLINGTQISQISNFPATQKVAGTVNAIIASGLYTVTGHVTIDSMPPVTIDTSALALNSTLINGTQITQVSNFPSQQHVLLDTSPIQIVGGVIASGVGTYTVVGSNGAPPVNVSGNLNVSIINTPTVIANAGTGIFQTSATVTNLPSIQPVSGTVNAIIASGLYTITGHVTVDAMPTITLDTTLLAKDTTLTNGNQVTQVSNFPTTQKVSGTVNAIIASGLYTVTGHVTVDNFPSSQAVTVTNTPTVTANAGSGTFATSATVSNFPAIQQVYGTVNALIASGLYTITGHVTVDQMPPISVNATSTVSGILVTSGLDLGYSGKTAPNPISQVGGQDSTGKLRPLLVNTDGALIIETNEETKTTYRAAVNALAVAAAATDVFTITGSASKTIRITEVRMFNTQTTSSNQVVLLIKRSTANTGGTSTAQTAVSMDSNDTAATATVLAYTANPTLGTTVGTILADRMFFQTVATAVGDRVAYFFTDIGKEPTLRGTGEVLAINLNGATIVGGAMMISITWIEE